MEQTCPLHYLCQFLLCPPKSRPPFPSMDGFRQSVVPSHVIEPEKMQRLTNKLLKTRQVQVCLPVQYCNLFAIQDILNLSLSVCNKVTSWLQQSWYLFVNTLHGQSNLHEKFFFKVVNCGHYHTHFINNKCPNFVYLGIYIRVHLLPCNY